MEIFEKVVPERKKKYCSKDKGPVWQVKFNMSMELKSQPEELKLHEQEGE